MKILERILKRLFPGLFSSEINTARYTKREWEKAQAKWKDAYTTPKE